MRSRASGAGVDQALDALGERLRIVLREHQGRFDAVDERVEAGIRDEHRQARRGGLEDDLVERAAPHVVDERTRTRVHRRDLGSRDRLLHGMCKRRAIGALLVRQRRPAQLELDPVDEPGRGDERVEALGGRGSPEREQPERAVRLRDAGDRGDIDPVADRTHLRRVERERAPVDREHGASRRAHRPAGASTNASA